jgi:hypothetical protein
LARELAQKRERDRRKAERSARILARKAAAKVRTVRAIGSRPTRQGVPDPESAFSPPARLLRAKFRDRDMLRLVVLAAEIFGRPKSEVSPDQMR